MGPPRDAGCGAALAAGTRHATRFGAAVAGDGERQGASAVDLPGLDPAVRLPARPCRGAPARLNLDGIRLREEPETAPITAAFEFRSSLGAEQRQGPCRGEDASHDARSARLLPGSRGTGR
jgi:hypothetical protein